jgi:hypothetical protein
MTKPKKTNKSHDKGPIAAKVLSGAQRILQSKVIDISAWRDSRIRAEDFEKTMVSEKELRKLDPVHAVYVYAQNKMSVIVEQLSDLPMVSKLADAIEDAYDEYMPSGPPWSPLTKSYFSCWGFFDLSVGSKRESFGSVAIEVCKFFNSDEGLIHVLETMQASRMGFYVQEGSSGEFVFLREMITGRKIKAIVPSGHKGSPGEIWLARILPPPFAGEQFQYSVVFTTPYVVGAMKDKSSFSFLPEEDWLAYFARNLPKTGLKEPVPAYEHLMKHGLGKNYWNEYIFLAYVNHKTEMILLAGFPDVPTSLPHSPEGQKRLGF